MNACSMEAMSYKYNMWEYLCDVNNYVTRTTINNRLPHEVFWGETLDISMIRFKL